MFAAMVRAARKRARKIVAFFKRMFVNAPRNEYERVLFDAAYSLGSQLRRGLAG